MCYWEPITDVVVGALKNAGPNSYPWITLGRSLLQLLTMETRQGEVGQCFRRGVLAMQELNTHSKAWNGSG